MTAPYPRPHFPPGPRPSMVARPSMTAGFRGPPMGNYYPRRDQSPPSRISMVGYQRPPPMDDRYREPYRMEKKEYREREPYFEARRPPSMTYNRFRHEAPAQRGGYRDFRDDRRGPRPMNIDTHRPSMVRPSYRPRPDREDSSEKDDDKGKTSDADEDFEMAIERVDSEILKYESLLNVWKAQAEAELARRKKEEEDAALRQSGRKRDDEQSSDDDGTPTDDKKIPDDDEISDASDDSWDEDKVPVFIKVYAENRSKFKPIKMPPRIGLLQELPFYNENIESFEMEVRPHLAKILHNRRLELEDKKEMLQEVFARKFDKWSKRARELKDKEDQQRMEIMLSPAEPGMGQRSRRGRGGGFGVSDVINSEAEFEQVLAKLKAQEDGVGPGIDPSRWAVDPPMELDPAKRDAMAYRDRNTLVIDPTHEVKRRAQAVIWSEEERKVYRQKFTQHGKDFPRIARHLPNKTWNDCVDYYYRNKHTEGLKALLRRQNGYWNRRGQKLNQPFGAVVGAGGMSGPRRAPVGARPRDMSEEPLPPDEGDVSNAESDSGWTDFERALFVAALSEYGKDFAAVSDYMGKIKTEEECREFWATHRRKLKLDEVVMEADFARRPARRRGGERTNNQIEIPEVKKRKSVAEETAVPAAADETDEDKQEGQVEAEMPVISGRKRKTTGQAGGKKKKKQAEDQDVLLSQELLQSPVEEVPKHKGPMPPPWNLADKKSFVKAWKQHGKNFAKIASILGSKTTAQVRAYYNYWNPRFDFDNMLVEAKAKQAAREALSPQSPMDYQPLLAVTAEPSVDTIESVTVQVVQSDEQIQEYADPPVVQQVNAAMSISNIQGVSPVVQSASLSSTDHVDIEETNE
jgi:hypothetical protein